MASRPLRDALVKTLANHPVLELAANVASNVVNEGYTPKPGETMPAVKEEDTRKILGTLVQTLSDNGMTIAEVKPTWASKELWIVAVGLAGVVVAHFAPSLDPATSSTATMVVAGAALGLVGIVRGWFTRGPVGTPK